MKNKNNFIKLNVIASRMPCKLALARLCSNMLVPV